MTTASILHIDMDAFFASVELLERPELIGEPAVVAHDGPRSVVSSATYAARELGIRSAMPLTVAKRLCPTVVVLEPHFEKYRALSAQVMSIFEQYTPLVEQLSIDEAFLDVSGARRLHGDPADIARNIKTQVIMETGLFCSVGVAENKFVAKVASTASKPNGLLIIEPDKTLEFLHPLPIEALWGVGKVTAEKLHKRGLHTVGDIASTPQKSLVNLLGHAAGEHLTQLAMGRDPRTVTPERIEKSISHEQTFEVDISDAGRLKRAMLAQSNRVASQLRESGWQSRTISIKVTYSNFETITRSVTLPEPTSIGRMIHRIACELFDNLEWPGRSVRLIGVRAGQLVEAGTSQLSLWQEDDGWGDLEQVIDQVSHKFGSASVRPASLMSKLEKTRESGTPG